MAANFIAVERLIHSLKTAIAISAAYLLARLIGQPADQWIVISVIVVMCAQLYVGSIIHKSYLRLLGTLLGCLLATAPILFFTHSFITVLITIAIAGFIFSYIATSNEKYSQMGTLGAVTVIIILFGNPPTLWLALTRFLEISVGILIAAIVSQFIFPIHARTHLRRAQAATLQQIKNYFMAVVANRQENMTNINSDMDESIIKSLLVQRQLANDSSSELIGKRFDPTHFARSLYCEREVLRSINFMDIALTKIESAHSMFVAPGPLHSFNLIVNSALDVLIRGLKTNQLTDAHVHIPNLPTMLANLQQATNNLPEAEHIYLDGFIFAAEVMLTNLRELAQLYKIPITNEPQPKL